eukprot:COSAG05_NODE_776_length_7410_cov_24.143482_1_plen_448_part_00
MSDDGTPEAAPEPEPAVNLELSVLDTTAPDLGHQPQLRPSWGGRRRTDADRLLNVTRTSERERRMMLSAGQGTEASGWTTPRDSRSSLVGLRALASSSVLREDVYQSLIAVTQGKKPFFDDASLHNITAVAVAAAAASDDVGGGYNGLSVRSELSGILHGVHAEPSEWGGDLDQAASPRQRSVFTEHMATVGSRALRGGQASVLKYVHTNDEVMAASDQQRKLGDHLATSEKQLEAAINETEDVEGISTISWHHTCARKAKQVASLRHQQHTRRDMVTSGTTLQGELDMLLTVGRSEAARTKAMKELTCLMLGATAQAAANRRLVANTESGKVISALLQLLASLNEPTQVEAAWALTLLADEASARRAIARSNCGKRLLRRLIGGRSSDSLAEAVAQLLARLSYDDECARMLIDAGARHEIPIVQQSPNTKVRDLCSDILDNLGEFG